MHIFNMSKIRHNHREYDTRGRYGTNLGPNQGKVGSASPTSLVGQPGVGAFSNSSLPTRQGRLAHGASNAHSRCGQETWLPSDPSWLIGLTSGPPEPHFRPKLQLNPPINIPLLLPAKRCEESELPIVLPSSFFVEYRER
jgi:hypothetical protein